MTDLAKRLINDVVEATPSKKDKSRDLSFAGYKFTAGPKGTKIHRSAVDVSKQGDYGCDPLGGGKFKMVPSGDIVDTKEMRKRLGK